MSRLTKRRLSDHKIGVPIGFTLWVSYCKLIACLPLRIKLYTNIFTDPSDSGKYVRETVKKHSPMVWRSVSKQLYDLGYNFPEMNEVVSGNFPTGLINIYEASK